MDRLSVAWRQYGQRRLALPRVQTFYVVILSEARAQWNCRQVAQVLRAKARSG